MCGVCACMFVCVYMQAFIKGRHTIDHHKAAPVVKKPSKERDSAHRGTGGTSGGSKRRRVKKMVRKMYVNEEGGNG